MDESKSFGVSERRALYGPREISQPDFENQEAVFQKSGGCFSEIDLLLHAGQPGTLLGDAIQAHLRQ
jgi:hypothetical protein